MTIIEWLVSWNSRLRRRAPESISLVVLHCTELPTLNSARRAAEESPRERRRCTAGHYYVDRDGAVYRFVEDLRITGHVEGHNDESIGIELVNRGRYPHWFRSDHQTPTEHYPQAQLTALRELLSDLRGRFPNLDSLARHSDLDQRLVPAEDDPKAFVRRRIDPGPLFPWEATLAYWSRLGVSRKADSA